MSGDRWGVTTRTGVAGPYASRDEAVAAALGSTDGPVVPWAFEDARPLPSDPIVPWPPDEATQWGPGSPAAADRGCTCDPGVVTTFGGRAQPHPVAYDEADVWCPPIIDPDCPIHRRGAP